MVWSCHGQLSLLIMQVFAKPCLHVGFAACFCSCYHRGLCAHVCICIPCVCHLSTYSVLQVDGTQSMDDVFSAIDEHLSKLSESRSHALAA